MSRFPEHTLHGPSPPDTGVEGPTFAEATGLVACRVCGLPQRVQALPLDQAAYCGRCGARIREHKPDSLRRTLAFSLAALILYLPANLYPILRMEWYGAHTENTVWEGSVRLFEDGQWLVAGIVFLASIVIPLMKLMGLFYLCVSTRYWPTARRRERTRIYRVITVIGPWAMLDVFLLAVMVALVKLGQYATILPGTGLFAFTAVVVLTILAASSFDPRLIWDEQNEPRRNEPR